MSATTKRLVVLLTPRTVARSPTPVHASSPNGGAHDSGSRRARPSCVRTKADRPGGWAGRPAPRGWPRRAEGGRALATTRKPAIAGERARLLQSGLPSFIGAPWIACDTETIRSPGATGAIPGVPFDQATVYRSGARPR